MEKFAVFHNIQIFFGALVYCCACVCVFVYVIASQIVYGVYCGCVRRAPTLHSC